MNNSPPVFPRPARGEWLALFALLGTAFLMNLLTYAMYPAVWNDDILWSEPAINLVRTGHFTTSVWQLQPANTFWSTQSPFYPLALSVWLRLAGFSLLAVRSFNFLLITVAAVLTWIVSWRFELVKRQSARLLMVGLVLLGYGISFAYRSSRPDVCGLISLLSLGLAFSVTSTRGRTFWIFLCAAITPIVGVQVGLYACCAVFLAKIVFSNVSWRDVVIVGMGVGLGACGVLAFYALNGVLPYFMASLHQAASEQMVWGHTHSYISSVPRRLWFALSSYFGDFSAPPLVAGLAVAFFARRDLFSNAKAFRYLLGLFFIIPVSFSFMAHFAFYYSYMIYVPLVLAFSAIYSNAQMASGRTVLSRALFPLCAIGAVALGLPLRLLLCGAFYQLTPRDAQREIIQAHVHPQDVVFSDYNSFFEVKQCVQQVFIPAYSTNFVMISASGHDFTPEEKKEITVLVVDPEKIVNLGEYFGGQRKAASEPFGDKTFLGGIAKAPIIGPRVAHHFDTPQMIRRNPQIFRRVETPP